jgi:hypothetical protein
MRLTFTNALLGLAGLGALFTLAGLGVVAAGVRFFSSIFSD